MFQRVKGRETRGMVGKPVADHYYAGHCIHGGQYYTGRTLPQVNITRYSQLLLIFPQLSSSSSLNSPPHLLLIHFLISSATSSSPSSPLPPHHLLHPPPRRLPLTCRRHLSIFAYVTSGCL